MPLNLTPLVDQAFLVADAMDANRALSDARAQFDPVPGRDQAFSYEVVVPEGADRAWLEQTLLPRLVYHCESTRSALPECQGLFVSLFQGERLACVAARDVVAWAGEVLATTPEELAVRFGTGESTEPVPLPDAPPPLLPGRPKDDA